MKNFPLLFIILLLSLLTSCDKIINPDKEEVENYYVSVRIVDLSTSTPIVLASHLVGIKVGDKSLTSGYTDSNGWFTSGWELNKSDFVTLTIFNKALDKSVKTESFSPTNHPEMFVKNKNDFKTNIPSVGYHIYTYDLNDCDSTSLKEIFPLSIGKSYLYSYYYYERPRTSDFFNSDSGTIQYVILDSIKLSNTIVQWQVKEIQHLYHRQLISYGDTATNLIDTTNMFLIEEDLKDLHELKCKSVAWNFPFIDSIFIYPTWSKTVPKIISRYSHDDKYILANHIYENPILLQDTLLLYENRGMTYFRRDYMVQLMSGYYETVIIKLIN